MRRSPTVPGRPALLGIAGAVAVAGCTTGGAGHDRGRSGLPARPTEVRRSDPADDPRGPTRRLTGTPLNGRTGLRFLIAADPPVLLDPDGGSKRTIRVSGGARTNVLYARRVGSATVLLSLCDSCESGGIYLLDRDASGMRRFATGSDFVPAADGRGIWVWRSHGSRRCSVVQIGLDGRTRTPERDDRCDRSLFADTPMGLLLGGREEGSESIIERHENGEEIFRETGVNAVAGRQVLSDRGIGNPFVLTDTDTGAQTEIPKPTAIGLPTPGLLAPDGRTLAVSFDHPAWPGPRERMDTWVLDLVTRTWRRTPAMPVNASLKNSGMEWTPDGRLILLGRFDQVGDVLALWRPGDAQWALRKVRLPRQGADQFVVLPGG